MSQKTNDDAILLAAFVKEEISQLLDIAWGEYDKAIEENDMKMANFWKDEALDLICKLPENVLMIRTVQ